MHSIAERAIAYLERMPPAISGSGGHLATYAAAVTLIRGFAMPEEDALPILSAWNQTHCQPPWREADLRRKLRSATNSTKRLGFLLNEPARGYSPNKPARQPRRSGVENENEEKARLRQYWPQFKPLRLAGLEAFSRLRKLPLASVILAARAGFLKGAEVNGTRSFIIHEGTFAQARRLDGQYFTTSDGEQIKAKNLPGAQGAFIGTRWLGDASQHVLLVEGAIALIEALAAHELSDPSESWTILAATSASSRFERSPGLLPSLSGRFVRIIPDADSAGHEAAASWLGDLEAAGCQVDIRALPDGIKDLGPIVANPSDHQETLNAIFQL